MLRFGRYLLCSSLISRYGTFLCRCISRHSTRRRSFMISEEERSRIREGIDRLVLLDDLAFSYAFRNDKKAIQLILKCILGVRRGAESRIRMRTGDCEESRFALRAFRHTCPWTGWHIVRCRDPEDEQEGSPQEGFVLHVGAYEC